MANSSNAYATERPLQTSITDWVAKQADMDLAYKQEKRLADTEAERKRAEREKRLQDFVLNTPKFAATGVETEDEYMYKGVQLAVEKLGEYNKKYNILRDKDNLSDSEKEEYYKLGSKINALQKYPENLKEQMESSTNALLAYRKGVEKGEMLYDPKIENIFKNGIKGFIPGIDEETGMPTAGIFDKDGDGVVDVLSFDEIKNGLHIKPTLSKDPFSLVAELGKTFKADIEKKRLAGTYINQETELVNDTQALSTIRGLLDGNALATEASKRGLSLDYQWKPEEVTKLESELLSSLKSFVQESDKKTFDSSDQNTDQARADKKVQDGIKNNLEREKLNLQRQKAADDKKIASGKAKAKGEQLPEFGEATTPSVKNWGNDIFKQIDTKTTKSVPISGSVKLRSVRDNKGNVFTDPVLENYTVLKDGRVAGDFSYVDSIGKKSKGDPEVKKRKQIIFTNETVSEIADELGITIDEFKSKAKTTPNQIQFDAQGNIIE